MLWKFVGRLNFRASGGKIGKNFDMIHSPAPGFEKMRRHYYPLLRWVLDKGPFYRFAWGAGTDRRLKHHPVPSEGEDKAV